MQFPVPYPAAGARDQSAWALVFCACHLDRTNAPHRKITHSICPQDSGTTMAPSIVMQDISNTHNAPACTHAAFRCQFIKTAMPSETNQPIMRLHRQSKTSVVQCHGIEAILAQETMNLISVNHNTRQIVEFDLTINTQYGTCQSHRNSGSVVHKYNTTSKPAEPNTTLLHRYRWNLSLMIGMPQHH